MRTLKGGRFSIRRLRCDQSTIVLALPRVENVMPHTQITSRLPPDNREIPLTFLLSAAFSDLPNEVRAVTNQMHDDIRRPHPDIPRFLRLDGQTVGLALSKIGSGAAAAAGLILAVFLSSTALAENESDPGRAVSQAPLFESVGDLRTIAVITNRLKQRRKPLASRFGGGRGALRHASCSVSRTRIPGLQPLADTVSFHVPQSIDIVETVEEFEPKTFWRGFAAAAGDKRPTLYVHGYRVGFAKACRRAARLQDNLGLEGRLAIFSWPSDGTALGYSKDEANVIWSIPDLQATIERMAGTFGAGGFNVVAHSLGARGVIGALLRATPRPDAAKPLLNRLILIAPDVDAGIFAQHASQVTARARTTSLYVSERDAPLALSREVHGYPRLGEKGPHLKDLDGIETIDVTDLNLSTPTGHLYHLFNGAVIDSLRKRVEGD